MPPTCTVHIRHRSYCLQFSQRIICRQMKPVLSGTEALCRFKQALDLVVQMLFGTYILQIGAPGLCCWYTAWESTVMYGSLIESPHTHMEDRLVLGSWVSLTQPWMPWLFGVWIKIQQMRVARFLPACAQVPVGAPGSGLCCGHLGMISKVEGLFLSVLLCLTLSNK